MTYYKMYLKAVWPMPNITASNNDRNILIDDEIDNAIIEERIYDFYENNDWSDELNCDDRDYD